MDEEAKARVRANVEQSRQVRRAREFAAFYNSPAVKQYLAAHMEVWREAMHREFERRVLHGEERSALWMAPRRVEVEPAPLVSFWALDHG